MEGQLLLAVVRISYSFARGYRLCRLYSQFAKASAAPFLSLISLAGWRHLRDRGAAGRVMIQSQMVAVMALKKWE